MEANTIRLVSMLEQTRTTNQRGVGVIDYAGDSPMSEQKLDVRLGNRIRIHPATRLYRVVGERSGKRFWLAPANILEVVR